MSQMEVRLRPSAAGITLKPLWAGPRPVTSASMTLVWEPVSARALVMQGVGGGARRYVGAAALSETRAAVTGTCKPPTTGLPRPTPPPSLARQGR